jgi:hypothetical protein
MVECITIDTRIFTARIYEVHHFFPAIVIFNIKQTLIIKTETEDKYDLFSP